MQPAENPFDCEAWKDFWIHVKIGVFLDLFDKPVPKLRLFDSDLAEHEENRKALGDEGIHPT